jgi:hypothetical protein
MHMYFDYSPILLYTSDYCLSIDISIVASTPRCRKFIAISKIAGNETVSYNESLCLAQRDK